MPALHPRKHHGSSFLFPPHAAWCQQHRCVSLCCSRIHNAASSLLTPDVHRRCQGRSTQKLMRGQRPSFSVQNGGEGLRREGREDEEDSWWRGRERLGLPHSYNLRWILDSILRDWLPRMGQITVLQRKDPKRFLSSMLPHAWGWSLSLPVPHCFGCQQQGGQPPRYIIYVEFRLIIAWHSSTQTPQHLVGRLLCDE